MYLPLYAADERSLPHAGSQRPTYPPPNTFAVAPRQRISDLPPENFSAAAMQLPWNLDSAGGGLDTGTPMEVDRSVFHRAWVDGFEEYAELAAPAFDHSAQQRVEELPQWMGTCSSAPHREITPAVNAAPQQLTQPRSRVRDHEMCNTGDDHACIPDAGVQRLNDQWTMGGCLSDGGPDREVVGTLDSRIPSIAAGVMQQMGIGRGQHMGQPGGHTGSQHTSQMDGGTAFSAKSLLRSPFPPQGVGQSRGQMEGQTGVHQGGQMGVRSASSTTNLPAPAIPGSAGCRCSLAQLCSAGHLPCRDSRVLFPHNPINSYDSRQAGTQALFSDPQGRCSQSVQPSSRLSPAAVSTEELALSALGSASLATPMGENTLAFLVDKV